MKNWKIALIASLLFTTGCSYFGATKKDSPSAASAQAGTAQTGTKQALIKVKESDYPYFIDKDSKKSLLKALDLNAKYLKNSKKETAYDFDGRKVTIKDLAAANEALEKAINEASTPEELDKIIKERFDIYQMSGVNGDGIVTFTSYYEPTTQASLVKTDEYKYPMYAKPFDLVSIPLEQFNAKFKGESIQGRFDGIKFVPYFSRDEIDFQGKLKGKGLEIAWFKNLPDLMDLHIQGSGRLALPDGREVKALFAATNGLKFKGWLTALIEQGLLPKEGISHEKGKEYLEKNPGKLRQAMSSNPRYTFFKIQGITDPEEGPNGTYGYPLTGWRSAAADMSLYPMGAAAFMAAPMPDVDDEGNYRGTKEDSRFVFVQDTGGAIKGTNRIDFFAGNGKKSRAFAFKVMNKGKMYILLLKEGK